jgi:hypothetical protein
MFINVHQLGIVEALEGVNVAFWRKPGNLRIHLKMRRMAEKVDTWNYWGEGPVRLTSSLRKVVFDKREILFQYEKQLIITS